MKVTRFALCAVALLLLAAGISYSQALSVGFGEIDYQAVEGNGGRYAVVQKTGENVADLVVTVTTLRFDQLDPNEKPSEITSVLDPAEYEEHGRKDFYQVVETLTFPPSMVSQDLQVFLPFYDDDINEEQEGYFAMVRVNASASDPQDVATLQYIRNGIALIIINDDDEIRLSFERDRYTVREGEGDGRYNELLNVCKEDDGLTERTLTVLIQMNPLSGVEAAIEGEDYEIESDFLRLTFQPDEQKMYIPFQVKDDAIAEYTERFNLFLSVPINGGWRIGRHYTTNVYIEDNDVAVIGFEKEEYTVGEEDGSVDVCIKLFSPAVIELFVDGTVTTIEKSAQEGQDFQSIEEIFFIFNEEPRVCFSIPIVNDDLVEAVETFTVTVTIDRTVTPENARIIRNTTTVIIADDDVTNIPPVCECDVNAECVEVSESERQCVCNHGYTGNGTICTDIDECLEDADRCSSNADCTNTPGSYECECRTGFTGNGTVCYDIDECLEDTDRCSSNADCTNTPGSYECECRRGYTGNGTVCQDIDECTEGIDRCSSNANCINIPGSYRCECRRGFTGNGIICRDIDECYTNAHRCSEYAYCRNTIGGYECHCRTGFTGNGIICNDINECRTGEHECSSHALCYNEIGSYQCHCKWGFEGDGFTCTPIQEDEEDTTRTRTRTPGRTRSRTPSRTPGRTPARTPGRTPARTPGRTPSRTPARTPSRTPARTPSRTPARTPGRTPSRTPGRTPGRTPSRTPGRTPGRTPSRTPDHTPARTPSRTEPRTPGRTPSRTPARTPSRTRSKIRDRTPKTGPKTPGRSRSPGRRTPRRRG